MQTNEPEYDKILPTKNADDGEDEWTAKSSSSSFHFH